MIKMICGPMKSMKSTLLFSEATKLDIGKKKYVLLRPKTDTRQNPVRGVKDDFKHLNIKVLDKLEDLEKPLSWKYVLIDEFQFFEGGTDFVLWLSQNDVNVIVACLNADSNAEGWKEVDKLFHHTNELVKLNAVCSLCGSLDATYSYFKGTKGSQVTVGDDEYQPLCLKCYRALKE